MPLPAGAADLTDPSEKRPGAFRTISEVAEDLEVPQHVLRFWETKFVQIKPVKRAGGRRYYRPDDIDLIKGVRHLLHGQGYTIRGAQRILKENGPRFVQSVGRGEAEVTAPAIEEAEAPEATSGGGLSAADRGLLEGVLRDLHACRDTLAAMRLPPEAVGEG
ncbi:MAG TPA: MerR family transcriptional regulator [Methylobacterium sp.]